MTRLSTQHIEAKRRVQGEWRDAVELELEQERNWRIFFEVSFYLVSFAAIVLGVHSCPG